MNRAICIAACLILLALAACDEAKSGGGGGSGGTVPALLAISTTTLPVASELNAYNATISASGGTGTGYSWSIVAGALPAGLTISGSGTPGTSLSGTPSVNGTFIFTVQVQDSAFATATQGYALVVQPASSPMQATYYGESAAGRVLFVCDVSAGTTGAINTSMRNALVSCISNLTATDEFEVLLYSTAFGTGSFFLNAMWGALLPATAGNIASAVAWVQGPDMNPWGSADDAGYQGIRRSYQGYTNIDRAFYSIHDGGNGAANTLTDFPGWSVADPNRLVIVVEFSSASAFCQQFAALAGGIYIVAP